MSPSPGELSMLTLVFVKEHKAVKHIPQKIRSASPNLGHPKKYLLGRKSNFEVYLRTTTPWQITCKSPYVMR